MKNKLLVSLFFSFLIINANPLENALYLKVDFSTCHACIAKNYQLFSQIDHNRAYFVLPEFISKDVEANYTNQIPNARFFYSDSLFEAMHPVYPAAVLVCNGEKIASKIFKGDEDASHFSELQLFPCFNFEKPSKFEVAGVPFSTNMSIRAAGDGVMLHNRSANQITHLSEGEVYQYNYSAINTDSLLRLEMSPEAFKIHAAGDSLFRYHDIKSNASFGSVHFGNDTLYVLSSVQIFEKEKAIFSSFRKIVVFNFHKGSLTHARFFDEKVSKRFLINEFGGLYVVKDIAYVRVNTWKSRKKTKPFVYFKNQNGKYVLQGKADFKLPKDLFQNKHDEVDVFGSHANDGVFYFYSSNTVYNAKTLISLEMPFSMDKMDFEKILQEGFFPQNHFTVKSNVVYYWSLFSDRDRLLILVRDRAGEVLHSYDISALDDKSNTYTLGKEGLYIFNPKTATVTVYSIE